MSRGSLQAVPAKLTPNGEGLASKPWGNGGVAAFGTVREGNDDGRDSPVSRDRMAPDPRREQDRVELFRRHDLVDPVRRRQRDILRAIELVTAAIGLDVHLVGNVELRLPVLERVRLRMRQVPVAQLGQRLHRRGGAEARKPLVEIALHAVLEDDGAARIHALRSVGAAADLPAQEIPVCVLSTTLGMWRGRR